MEAAFSPGGQGGYVVTTVGQDSNSNQQTEQQSQQSQGQPTSSITSSSDVDGMGPIEQLVEQLPLSENDIRLAVDLANLAAVLLLIYYEVI